MSALPVPPEPTREDTLDAELSRAARAYRKAYAEAAEAASEMEHEAALALAELVLLRALRSAAAGYADGHAAAMVERYARGPYVPSKAQRGERGA